MTDARYGRGAACPAGARHVDARDSDASVKETLLEWVPEAGQDVIVLWDERVGAVAPWGMFCDYWNDFCYPASDDNFIVPFAGSWFSWYDHEDRFLVSGGYQRSTVIPGLEEVDAVATHQVHDAMFLRRSMGPGAGEDLLERFGLAGCTSGDN
jgi:hypothetical protein